MGAGAGAGAGEVEGCDYAVTASAALSRFPGNYKAMRSSESGASAPLARTRAAGRAG